MAKKKNTYSIKFKHLVNYRMFELSDSTPLVVAKKNGTEIKQTGVWDVTTEFPNPGAIDMGLNFEPLKNQIGEKMATTIIEYLDKETNRPVVTVFPTYLYIHNGYDNNFHTHLNHATRKDLQYQITMRRNALAQCSQR
ncbi:MAG: hypothetical protein K2L25_03390 [Alphaproteobacteria bacterium]|nr:hypothetical protein [Alphaproteobacteria bacterium]